MEQIAEILGNARSAGGLSDQDIARQIVTDLKLDDAPAAAKPAAKHDDDHDDKAKKK
jgi:hypothetical protein